MRTNWRQLRILALLLVLLGVALTTAQNRWRTTDWNEPLWVAMHPVNGDGSAAATNIIEALRDGHFRAVEHFVQRQARHYGIDLPRPVQIHLAEPVHGLPPPPPESRRWWQVAWWSLGLRYWAWRATSDSDIPADIRVFAVYHDPQAHSTLAHSYGLEKAQVGVAHLFAARAAYGRNQVVLAHELFHILGATDKYDPDTDLPLYPTGYADPEQRPLLPQRRAEIMAGRVPLGPGRAEMPASLDTVLVGPATALEIGW